MSYNKERLAAQRELMPDLTRAFALIGIALVNVGIFSYPMMAPYEGALNSGIDRSVYFLVNSLFFAKSYTLFSFMFGVGFAYQIRSAQSRDERFRAQYSRRIIGLIALGVLHVVLAFQGDILIIYGLLGIILYLARNLSTKNLIIWSVILFGLEILLLGLVVVGFALTANQAPDVMVEIIQEINAEAVIDYAVFGGGMFQDAVILRIKEYGDVLSLGTLVQGPVTLACFFLGLVAVRSGFISNPNHKLWGQFRKYALPTGLIGSAIGAYYFGRAESNFSPDMMFGMFLIFLFSPISTAGYLGWIAKWVAGGPSNLKTFLARGGTASLSAYLMQSLILSFIFNNYGLGWYGTLGAATCIVIAFGTAVFTIVFSSLWRKKYKIGPMEFFLRSWTYLGRRPAPKG